MCARWGEIPDAPNAERLVLPAKDKLYKELLGGENELPPIHQPSARHFPPGISDSAGWIAAYRCDALTAHTIRLQQHARAVQLLIDGHRLKQEQPAAAGHTPTAKDQPVAGGGSSATPSGSQPVPPCVDCPSVGYGSSKLPFVLEFDDEPSAFDRGQGVAPPPLDQAATKRLLKRAVSFVVTHAGFESASQGSLEVVVDVAHEFYQRLTQLLRVAVDSEALRGRTGFQDPVQQALHEMGIGGVTELRRFYWSRVVHRHAHWLDRCQRLVQQYEQLQRTGSDEGAAGALLQLDETAGTADAVIHRSAAYPEANGGELESDDDNDDAEKLLQLAGMSGYDIKLEQRPGSGVSSRRETSDNEGHFDGPLDSDCVSVSSGPASTSSNVELLSPPHISTRHQHVPIKRRKT